MRNNPNCNGNLKKIMETIYIYTEISALLYYLYCSDFQISNYW